MYAGEVGVKKSRTGRAARESLPVGDDASELLVGNVIGTLATKGLFENASTDADRSCRAPSEKRLATEAAGAVSRGCSVPSDTRLAGIASTDAPRVRGGRSSDTRLTCGGANGSPGASGVAFDVPRGGELPSVAPLAIADTRLSRCVRLTLRAALLLSIP